MGGAWGGLPGRRALRGCVERGWVDKFSPSRLRRQRPYPLCRCATSPYPLWPSAISP